jgi:hypothetical protein
VAISQKLLNDGEVVVVDTRTHVGLVDRMLGCGTLIISDASTHGQVRLDDIPQVEQTQRKLNQLVQEIHEPSAEHEGI